MFKFLLIADTSGFFLGLLGMILFLISLFLIFIILIQRGKGGGIAGSLTGTAQSAFGARGGDILMWLTLSLTIIWILLCCLTIYFYSRVQESITEGREDADIQTDISPPSPENPAPIDALGSDGLTGETPPAVSPAIEPEDNPEVTTPVAPTQPDIDESKSDDTADDEQLESGATSGDRK